MRDKNKDAGSLLFNAATITETKNESHGNSNTNIHDR